MAKFCISTPYWKTRVLSPLKREDFLHHIRIYQKWLRDADNKPNPIAMRSRDLLIRSNLRLCVSIAVRFCRNDDHLLDDLMEEAQIGLCVAIDRFDVSTGNAFSTYATYWIRQKVSRYVIDKAHPGIRVPINKHEKIKAVRKTEKNLKSRLDRNPTEEEIAEVVEMTVDDVRKLNRIFREVALSSLDQPLQDKDGRNSLGDTVIDENSYVYKSVAEKEQSESLNELLNTLNDRDRQILSLRYGLKDGREAPYQEIGDLLGLSRERIRQLEQRILKKLQKTKKEGDRALAKKRIQRTFSKY